jgi:Domain of unknown function (DUF4337)
MGDFSPREIIEHEHHAQELIERGERELLGLVPLLAAVLAVLAGLSSLYGGRLGERILTQRTEAVLHEVAASDTWAQYQAESLKGHLYEISATTNAGPAGAGLRAKAKQYRGEQGALREQARRLERDRDAALLASATSERRKAGFDVAVALYEIAIVLTSVAALTRRPWLMGLAVVLGATAVFFNLRALWWTQ